MATALPYFFFKGLFFDGEPRWNADKPVGTPVNVTYSFLTSNPGNPNDTSVVAFDPNQRQVMGQILQSWEDVANITFTPAQEGTEGQIRFGMTATISGQGLSDEPRPGSATYTWIQPYWSDSSHIDAWNGRFDTFNGKYLKELVLHEVGHAIGLGHPGPYNFGDIEDPEAYSKNPDKYLSKSYDNTQYSIMSYNDGLYGRTKYIGSEAFPSTPLLFDIAAVQYLYGANITTRTGNDTYSWDSNHAFRQAIWDAGGIDTISAANQTLDAQIDLTDGVFSSIGRRSDTDNSRATNNLAIAHGVTIENAIGGAGNDTISGNSAANLLRGGSGDDKLYGYAGDDSLWGEDGNDTLVGFWENDSLFGGNGNDLLEGFSEDDYLSGDAGNDWLDGGYGNDQLYGGDGDDKLIGRNGSDLLYGGSGNDYLDGGSYIVNNVDYDILNGGIGSDTYIIGNGNSIIQEAFNSGESDTVQASISYTLGDNLENLILTESSAINGYGNSLNNVITGNTASNALYGADGNDTLDGGLGADLMAGGSGADSYYVDSGADTIVEYANEGIDTVHSSVNHILGNNVENLVLVGSESINGYGNSLNNVMTGNSGSNLLYGFDGKDILFGGAGEDVLDGGLDGDSMFGGQGNDKYYVDNINDTVIEYVNQGIDTVYASVSYTLPNNVEYFVLTGDGAVDITGNSVDNVLTGNDAANTLDGKAGNDTLYGNGGNDRLFGGEGNDRLIGGAGADTLNGGAGNDNASYITATAGIAANLTISRGLSGDAQGDVFQSIENLEGSQYTDNLIGNSQANILSGLSGDDFLDGRDGDDTLNGGDGNNVLYGESGNDLLNGGIGNDLLYGGDDDDTLLGANGTDYLEGGLGDDFLNGGTGDDLLDAGLGNNILNGGDGNDELLGGLGNDVLEGGTGADFLTGGGGIDRFIIRFGDGVDTIADFTGIGLGNNPTSETATEADVIQFEGADLIAKNMLLTQTGNDLAITFEGVASTQVMLKNFALENLDNLGNGPGTNSNVGNIQFLFNEQTPLEDNFDVFNAEWQNGSPNRNNGHVLNLNTVTFLNELDNTIQGFDNSDDVINGQGGNDRLWGLGGDDILRGGTGSDMLLGGAGKDYLAGGDGNDHLYGQDWNDFLSGNQGDDVLLGGSGINTLSGGVGNDIFALIGEGKDTVLDFTVGQDRIGLGNGFTFDQLTVTQGSGVNASSTWIKLNNTGDTLMTLNNVQASALTTSSFSALTNQQLNPAIPV